MILYLHGFCSSPASLKAQQMAAAMAEAGLSERFLCPALSPVPHEAIAQAEALIASAPSKPALVGSSLGGHYATTLAEKHDLQAVLINPAIIDRIDGSLFIGEHRNFHTDEVFQFTAEHGADLLAQVVTQPTPSRYWLLVETGDEVLDYRHAVERYAGARQSVYPGGDHSFTRFGVTIPHIMAFAGC